MPDGKIAGIALKTVTYGILGSISGRCDLRGVEESVSAASTWKALHDYYRQECRHARLDCRQANPLGDLGTKNLQRARPLGQTRSRQWADPAHSCSIFRI